MNQPLISIVVPTLQEEKLITRLVDQFTPELRSHHKLEIIISDGGSSDRTVELARPRVDVLVLPDGAGTENISTGRNRGARAARGKILVFLNADVRLQDPGRFFQVISTLIERPGIAALTCKVRVYPEEESWIDRVFHAGANTYFRLLNILGMGMGRGECHVVRGDLFQKVGGYDESIVAGADFELFHRLRRLGKIKYAPGMVVFESPRRYRKHGYRRVALLWFLNALCVLFSHRPFVREWEPVR